MSARARAALAAAAIAAILAGCAAGPDYRRPPVQVPADFKEARGWKLATPADASVAQEWWRTFDDPVLDDLQRRAAGASPTLAAAEARYRQATALVDVARAGLYPTLSATGAASRAGGASSSTRTTTTGTTAGTTTTTTIAGGSSASTLYSLTAAASWEIDLWGRVRRSIEASAATAQASADDLAAARLSLQATLAQDYWQLRTADLQRRLLESAVAAYERTLAVTRNRYEAGLVSRADVYQAETQLHTTRAQLVDVGAQRAQLEHAIAVLVGEAPATFALAPNDVEPAVAPPPALLPSALLERRPDIAAAERRMAAANAQIGVAQAAYFPTVDLGASLGFRSTTLGSLLSLPNRIWSLGPSLALTVFDAGARRARTEQARAAYDETVASYRQAVLAAFQEVEDNLSSARTLEQEADLQAQALRAAEASEAIAQNQYRAGTVSFLNVLTAQTALLSAQRSAADVAGRRMLATVQLLKNAGGQWQGAGGATASPRAEAAPSR